MRITLLMPTRKRVWSLKRLIESVDSTAEIPDEIEFSFYVDDDDKETLAFLADVSDRRFKVTSGKRIILSQMWNEAFKKATADVFMHAGDDIVFKTKDWDKIVLQAFDMFKDKIVFVHGNDLGYGQERFGTHGFVHRKWVETLGYFCPPYFSSDYNDTWLNDCANALGRRLYIPIITEHMHFTFNKGPLDETHQERLARAERDKTPKIYEETLPKRLEDIEKLKKVIYEPTT